MEDAIVTLAALIPDEAWKLKAACRGSDPSVFFVGRYDGRNASRQAKRICAGCPVQAECLDYALDWPQNYDYGIYAGTNSQQRRALRRERRAA